MWIALRLGLRNLARNGWRSGLTVAAVALSVALMVWSLGMMGGWLEQMVRGATAVETGQVQIHAAEYTDNPRIYESFRADAGLLERIERLSGVAAVTPRVEAYGLIGTEQRSQVARFLGVLPEREAAATPVADGVIAGAWLPSEPADGSAPRPAVLGAALAQQLQVGVGDELVVFLEAADGSLGNELLRVHGLVRTGNVEVDRMGVYLHLADAQYVTALEGQVHEVMVHTAVLDEAPLLAERIAQQIGARRSAPAASDTAPPGTLVVRSWQELEPGIYQMIALFNNSYWFMYLLVYLVAAVGILNTARMSALERRREFGVLLAIGMRPRRMFRTLLLETLVLGAAGALIGAAAGGLLTWYHARAGLDMSAFTDQTSFSYMGVAFTERMYFVLTAGTVVQPVLVMLAVALLSGLWPAVRAARIDPAPTIAGRT